MLLKLPTEVLVHCIEHLNHRSLIICRTVSRSLKEVLDHAPSIQLQSELGKSGFTQIYPEECGFDLTDMMQRLRELRTRWQTLAWTGKHTHAVPDLSSCSYELINGMFLKMDESGNILTLDLPTSRDDRFHIVAQRNVGCHPADFAVDPSQDVIIFLNVHDPGTAAASTGCPVSIRICSMSTMLAHPEASTPVLPCTVDSEAIWIPGFLHNATIQLAGALVAVYYGSGSTARLLVWNWRTGKVVGDSNTVPLPEDTHSFSFVSPALFYVTTMGEEGAIALYSVDESGELTGFTLIARLIMPTLQEGYFIDRFRSHTQAFQAETPSSRRTPFETLLERQLHVFNVVYTSVANPRGRLILFLICIPASLFLDYLAKYRSTGPADPIHATWTDWGPLKSRLLPVSGWYGSLRFVHGQRVILPITNGRIRILDFNVRRSVEEYIHPTTMPPESDIFSEVVTSQLPCAESSMPIDTKDLDGCMIDEERLICRYSPNEDANVQLSKIQVYTF